MSRQNLGAFIVSLAVVVGLIVAIFIVPVIQPRQIEARSALDEATERATRRMHVLSRSAERAVTADRRQLTLPAEISNPDQEAIQRAMAGSADLLGPTRKLAGNFRETLRQADEQYKQVAGAPETDAKTASALEPPTGESNQIAWVKQSFADRVDYAKKALADVDGAIADLSKSMSQAGSAGLSSSNHFRANYVMASLQMEKAMLLSSLAANQRSRAAVVRSQFADEYRWYMDAATRADAIRSRLKVVAADSAEASTANEEPTEIIARYEREIDEQIAASRQKIAQLEQSMVEPRQQLEAVRAEILQLQQELSQVDQAGYDVTDATSFEAYKAKYADLSSRLRRAEATAQGLEDGTMAGAVVDPETADDLTKAKYAGGVPQVGLNTLAKRLAGEQKIMATLEASRQDLRDSRSSLLQYNQSLDASYQEASTRAKTIHEQLNRTCEQLDALAVKAGELESQALAACKSAEQSYSLALQAGKGDQSAASSALSAASPSPDKPNKRLEMLRDYGSPEAGAERGLVDVYMLIARIHMQRVDDLYLHLGVLKMARGCQAQPADVEAVQMAIEESLAAAMMALASPDSNANAVYHSERLTQAIQREKFAWLGHATRGLVYNMLAQVQMAAGRPQAADTRALAAAALTEALKGNENSEMLQPYSQLLAALKRGI